jgi:hypothetical protein
MNESESQAEGGWTFLRVLGLIVGVLGMAGFGLCSLMGLPFVVSGAFWTGGGWVLILALWLPGLALMFAFFLLARAMVRRAAPKPPGPARS